MHLWCIKKQYNIEIECNCMRLMESESDAKSSVLSVKHAPNESGRVIAGQVSICILMTAVHRVASSRICTQHRNS